MEGSVYEGKTALVTGATGGIGKETALGLSRAGYRVLLTARDPAKGGAVLEEIREQGANGAPELYVGDLSSMDDVRRIALEIRAKHPTLDVLVNNAGGVFGERRTTVDGFEYTFALNHLAPFLLTNLLLNRLKAAGNARIVSVSSNSSDFGRMRWDDLEFRGGYSGTAAYAQSKLMTLLFANALARRLRGTGVISNSVHPGVVKTNFGGTLSGFSGLLFGIANVFSVTPEKGAETSVYLATSDEVAGLSGGFFAKKRPRRTNRVARDEAAQERLWKLSETLLSGWLEPVASIRVQDLGQMFRHGSQ